MKQLLGRRSTRFYMAGSLLSTFGDRSLYLAAGIWVRVLSGSNAEAGLTFVFLILPQLVVSPLAGMITDRFRRRPLLMISNLVGAGVVLLLLLVRSHSDVWLIYLVMVLYGSVGCLVSACKTALLVTIVPSEQLGDANGFIQTVAEGMRLVTPLAGAGVFALFGGAVVAEMVAATYLLAAASLLAVRARESKPERSQEHWTRELAGGFRHIWRTKALFEITVAVSMFLAVVGFAETAVFAVVTDGLHRPASFIGVLIAVQGVGAVASGITAAKVMLKTGESRLAAMGIAIIAAGALLYLSPEVLSGGAALGVAVLGSIVIGVGLPWLMVGSYTLIQRRTPLGLQGRVDAALGMLLGAVQTASIALGALLVGLFGYGPPLLSITAVGVLASLYLYTRSQELAPSQAQAPLEVRDPLAPRA